MKLDFDGLGRLVLAEVRDHGGAPRERITMRLEELGLSPVQAAAVLAYSVASGLCEWDRGSSPPLLRPRRRPLAA
jgi:hypothetical protein